MKFTDGIKSELKNLLYRERSTSKSYINYLRRKGVRVGEDSFFFSPKTTEVDVTRPWLISIGNDVQIARGVLILTHGYDWSVLRGKYGDILGSSGKVTIGNNVFIGANTTILKGSRVGNNVIIGAGSLVTNDLEDNMVYAGNPVRKICTLDEYYKKRIDKQLEEAKELVEEYVAVYKHIPSIEVLYEFFWLFEQRDGNKPGYSHPFFENMMKRKCTSKLQVEQYIRTEPLFKDYEEFIKYCGFTVDRE